MTVAGAITFDLWNTLYDDSKDGDVARREKRQQAYMHFIGLLGASVPEHELSAAIARADAIADAMWRSEARTLNALGRVNIVVDLLGLRTAVRWRSLLARAIEDIGYSSAPRLFPGALDLVARISSVVPVGLISDTGQTSGRVLRDVMHRDGLLQYFRWCSFSDEFGRSKPHSTIFKHTFQRLGVPAEQVIHIGDNVSTDVVGALNARCRVIHLSTEPEGRFAADRHYMWCRDVDQVWCTLTAHAVFQPCSTTK